MSEEKEEFLSPQVDNAQRLFGGSGDSGYPQANHYCSDHYFGHCGTALKVPDEAAITAKPTERALDHPSFRKWIEA